MKKKIFLMTAVLLIAVASALVINGNLFSNQQDEYPTFQVTVYQYGGTNLQSNSEVVVYNSNNQEVKSGMATNGVISFIWDQPYGNYTVKAWYPARPNDGQNGQTNVSYSGASIYTSVTLGPWY